jgi:ribonuclease R
MTLRERLLAKLGEPDYRPANNFILSRLLGLNKKLSGSLASEIRQLVAAREVRLVDGGRVELAGRKSSGKQAKPIAEFARESSHGGPARSADSRQPSPKSSKPDLKERFKAHVENNKVSARPIFHPAQRGPQGDPFAPTFSAPTPEPASGKSSPSKSAPLKNFKGKSAKPSARFSAPASARPSTPDRSKQKPTAASTVPDPNELYGRIQFRGGGSAFVILANAPSGPDTPAMQISPDDTGVALPGDTVAVRAYPGATGRRPGETVGRVTRIITREKLSVVGNVVRAGRNYLVAADDPRFVQQVLLSPSALEVGAGDKVVVKLDDWTDRRKPLTGVATARLGRTHEPRAELLGIYEKYNLATSFPADVEREAALLPDKVPAKDVAGRLDYRELPVFTIDPDDAKDFDDALSYETTRDGETKIGIHIADVSSYVRPGTALDREAQARGNSTYLVGTVIPMLPEKLSNGLCSLVEAQDRLCKAVFLTFSKAGKLTATAYANTAIRSRKRLTYKQAYAFLFTDDLKKIRALPLPAKHQTGSTGRALSDLSDAELTDLQTWIRALWKIASRLRSDRMEHGSLDLDMPETKIFVDKDGYADRLEKIEHDESHQLIEEFMLAANEAVARLTRTQKFPSLYRVHDDPDAERLGEFRQLLETFKITVGDLSNRKEVTRLLKILAEHPQGYTLRTQLLRSLQKAVYRHTHDGHYGLNKKDYTHFTSPIRRYSDLIVHRVLQHYLVKHEGYAPLPGPDAMHNAAGMERLGEHISLMEQNSQQAERESVKIKILEFFERELDKKPRTRFAAVITDVRRNGFFVELIESMTFGFVSADSLGEDFYTLDESTHTLSARRSKKKFTLNARLDVVVDKVDRFKRIIDFRPAD